MDSEVCINSSLRPPGAQSDGAESYMSVTRLYLSALRRKNTGQETPFVNIGRICSLGVFDRVGHDVGHLVD